MITLILVAIVAILVAFLLSAADTALTRMSRSRVEQLREEDRRGSQALAQIVADSAPYLSVATFVRVVAEATAAVAITVAVDIVTDSHWQTLLVAIAIMSVVSFVLVGVSPRTIGRQHGERVALLAAPIVRSLRVVLGPIAKLLILFGNAVTPGRGYTEGPFASEAELRDLVDLAGESAVIEAEEREMIHSIFELGDTVAREVMVPRPDMVTIHRDKVLRQAMSMFLRSGFSRVPVVGEDADDVQGVLYFKDVVRQVNANGEAAHTVPVCDVMRPVQRVPDSKPVDDLLREMQLERQHFAIVIDEYGGTAGLVTIEDILEEIVGEITDEYDRDVQEVEHLEDGTVRVPATMSVDDLGDMFGEEIEIEDVDSVGGLLAALIGMVPLVGSVGTIAGLELTAERMAGRRRRVSTVLVRRVDDRAEDASGRPSRDSAGTPREDNGRSSREGNGRSSREENGQSSRDRNRRSSQDDPGRTAQDDPGRTARDENGRTLQDNNGHIPQDDTGRTLQDDNGHIPQDDDRPSSRGAQARTTQGGELPVPDNPTGREADRER